MYTEGKAKINDSGKAFLNPKGKASRDLSVAYVSLLAKKGSKLIDGTSATGIRGIRYALESKVKNPVSLEINPEVFKELKANLKSNKVKSEALNLSIQEFCNTTKEHFDFIDLDPFGGISPYIFDLMKIVNDDCRLMVTATDTAVLCGADGKACMRIYDSKPIHNEICHEGGMRLMIGYITRIAAQFGIGVDVELSISYMHYMRSFIRFTIGAEPAYSSMARMGYLKYCDSCRNRQTDPGFIPKDGMCANCKGKMATYGRMWLGELKDQKIVDSLYKTIEKDEDKKEAAKLLDVIRSELDAPFYYHIPTLTKKYKLGSVSPYGVAERLSKMGYRTSMTHMRNSSIKTDAGLKEVMAAIRDKPAR